MYLVVEPNALKDLTCGLVDVTQGSLTINLQCLCPSYPNDVMAIVRRLTAYVSQILNVHCKMQSIKFIQLIPNWYARV